MKTNGALWIALLAVLLGGWRNVPFARSTDREDAISRSKQYFAEAKESSDADGGKLWGRPLYGPMLFLDTETRTIYGNQPDRENRIAEKDGVNNRST